jgi:hypothetical protein
MVLYGDLCCSIAALRLMAVGYYSKQFSGKNLAAWLIPFRHNRFQEFSLHGMIIAF